jgi:hypothetical protein
MVVRARGLSYRGTMPAWRNGRRSGPGVAHGQQGRRPDEAARLEYRDVSIVNDEATKQTILEIEVRGKRGVGYRKNTNGAVRWTRSDISQKTIMSFSTPSWTRKD